MNFRSYIKYTKYVIRESQYFFSNENALFFTLNLFFYLTLKIVKFLKFIEKKISKFLQNHWPTLKLKNFYQQYFFL